MALRQLAGVLISAAILAFGSLTLALLRDRGGRRHCLVLAYIEALGWWSAAKLKTAKGCFRFCSAVAGRVEKLVAIFPLRQLCFGAMFACDACNLILASGARCSARYEAVDPKW